MAVLLFASVEEARPDIYKYADERGIIHITNDIRKAPEKYRKKMEVRKESPKEALKPAEETVQKEGPNPEEKAVETKEHGEAEPAQSMTEEEENLGLFKRPVVKYGALSAAFVAGMIALNFVLGGLKGYRKAYKLALIFFYGRHPLPPALCRDEQAIRGDKGQGRGCAEEARREAEKVGEGA